MQPFINNNVHCKYQSLFEHLSGVEPIPDSTVILNHPENHSNTHKEFHRNRLNRLEMYKRHTRKR